MKRTILFPAFFLIVLVGCKTEDPWDPIVKPDMGKISPNLFQDQELDLPFFLANFHQVANGVVKEGDNRGFVDISVWRNPKDNKPYNARIMESILSLAYFYTTDRPWNVYLGLEQLRVRLEAAMEFWCSIQNEDGRFSEYGDGKWNLAATAFATKFMGETLQLLANGPEIDQAILKRTVGADRKAIMAVLTMEQLWDFGKGFSNQYSNVWAGALAYLDLYPDEEMEKLFLQRFEASIEDFQSPAGYFYERNGPDFAYNLGTHENNLMMAYHYTKGTDMGNKIIEKSQRFADWLVWNTVPESDALYFLNRSIETRRDMAVVELNGPFITQGLSLSEEVPLMRPFLRSREMRQEIIRQKRDSLNMFWPETKPLDTGKFFAFTPYDFLHRRIEKWFPSQQERQEALTRFPCLSDEYFIKTLKDTRKDVAFTYIKMPGYYAAFNHGEIISKQQRYGLSLLWSKETGVVWQSQTRNDPACWGTRLNDSTLIEAMDLAATVLVDGQPFLEGFRALTENSTIRIEYTTAGVSKQLLFRPSEVEVKVSGKGNIREVLPFISDDASSIAVNGESVQMKKRDGVVKVTSGSASIEETRQDFAVTNFALHPVTLKSTGNLNYKLQFE